MLRDGLTYSLWCIKGSELTLGEPGAEGGAPTLPGPPAGRRAAARRRRMTTHSMPIIIATKASPPMIPVENSSVRLDPAQRQMEHTTNDGTHRDRLFWRRLLRF